MKNPTPPAIATEPSVNARAGEGAAPAFSPLYQQIKTLMTRSLQAGEWRPAEAIPSEMELAARFKVSQGTVRKAVDELAAENLLVRRQGKGTFVATHAEQKVQYRFLRLQPDVGEPGGARRHFIDCRRLRCPADVARALELKPGDAFHIATGLRHRMIAVEDCDVLEVSTPDLTDVVRLQDDFSRPARD